MAGERNFVIKNGELLEYRGSRKNSVDLVIPAGVTRIGQKVFLGYSNLTSIAIPEGVTEIGYEAFGGCRSLKRASISKTVVKIEEGAFRDCSSLTSVTTLENVTSIGDRAFKNCRSLADMNGFVVIKDVLYDYFGRDENVIIPEGVTRISDEAFKFCRSLTSVTIPQSVTEIGWSAFSDCISLTSVTIPQSVTYIGGYAFKNCSNLTSVTIPENVTSIGKETFRGCRSLTSVTIPDSVTSIGEEAFWDCSSLTKVLIPKNVTSIGDGAFVRCGTIVFRCWQESFASSLNENNTIVILDEGVSASSFPDKLRKAALRGYASGEGRKEDAKIKKTYMEYAEKNAVALCPEAFTNPDLLNFLCRNKLIPAQYADYYMEEAERRGASEAIALLLNYQNEIRDELERAREKKEEERELYTDALVARSEKRDADKGIEDMTFVVLGTPQTGVKKADKASGSI